MNQNTLQNVTSNQLPELWRPKYKTINFNKKMTSGTSTIPPKKNPYSTKWYVLFDNRHEQWISFQPQPGSTVYPCYACKDMFANKSSFVDHVNRRGMLLKYKCTSCKKLMMFYNPCSFLLHARTHFTDQGGAIDLDHVDISMIPLNLAGLLPLKNIPRMFDNVDDAINQNLNLSVKFYKPVEDCAGKRIVILTSNDLIFFCTNNANANSGKETVTLTLRQVNKNIPRCQFMLMKITNKQGPVKKIFPKEFGQGLENMSLQDKAKAILRRYAEHAKTQRSNICMNVNNTEENVITEIIDLDSDIEANPTSDLESDAVSNAEIVRPTTKPFVQTNMPKIQVKNLNLLLGERISTPTSSEDEYTAMELAEWLKCPECERRLTVTLKDHFQEINRPMNDKIKCPTCGLLSPSACSLRAHKRIHDKRSPFVCPECGKVMDNWHELNSHMENVCYHRAKTVRFKCPAKKCGKVFAQTITFSSHFPMAHVKIRLVCDHCSLRFVNETDYMEHAITHTLSPDGYHNIHECVVCFTPVTNLTDHVLSHVQNRDNRIYVYICKHCRSYYRSKHTYAGHLLRCAKLLLNNQVKKEAEQSEYNNGLKCKIVKYCKLCNSKIQYICTYRDIKNVTNDCPNCSKPFFAGIMYKVRTINNYEYTDNIYVRKDVDTGNIICILCSGVLKPEEWNEYSKHKCKYARPIVNLDGGDRPKVRRNTGSGKANRLGRSNSSSVSNISCDSLVTLDESSFISSDESSKRKRKRLSNNWIKSKRPAIPNGVTEDILQISPMIFDGEYKCSVCTYRDESREAFHKHIQEHRDVSTAYQCMECGECFVVKPTLIKHLQVIHLIEDVESYFANNECYDKDAVRELEENMRLLPGEAKEPVAENQCRICRQMFPDSQELSKHFRVHGMAFLMKKIIK